MVSDITEHSTREGKLYIFAIKDVSSNRIVGYCMDSRMKSRLATTALHNAVARRGEVSGCIVHTDRRSQGGAENSSTLWVGTRWSAPWAESELAGDNAAMESFFSPLQKNVLDRHRWDTREELRIAVVDRTHLSPSSSPGRSGRLTPIEFEAITTTPASQAA